MEVSIWVVNRFHPQLTITMVLLFMNFQEVFELLDVTSAKGAKASPAELEGAVSKWLKFRLNDCKNAYKDIGGSALRHK